MVLFLLDHLEHLNLPVKASRNKLVIQLNHVCDDVIVPCVLDEYGLRVDCVPEDDLLVSANRQHKLSVVHWKHDSHLILMVDDLLDVARRLVQVPDLHNVVVTDGHTIILELAYRGDGSTSTVTRYDLVLMLLLIDLHQLEAIVVASSQQITLILPTLQLHETLDLSLLMNLTLKVHLQFLHVPDSNLPLRIGHSHHLLLSLAMVLQMNYIGDGRVAILVQHQLALLT